MQKIMKVEEYKIDIKEQDKCFLNYLDVSAKTKETYRINLKPFIRYLERNNITCPTRQDLIDYREELRQTLKPTTVNSYMIALRQFFVWLEYMNLYPNVALGLKGEKISYSHKKHALTKEQAKDMINNAKNLRDRCMLKLFFTTGLRCNELKNAKIEDIKNIDGHNVLFVLGKGKVEKTDFVLLDDQLYNEIKAYLGERTSGNIFTPLYRKTSENGLTNRQIRGIVKSYLLEIGLTSDNYSCHSTRHTFINLGFELGNDIYTMSKEARHSKISTTEIYLEEYNRLNSNVAHSISNIIN